MGKVSRCGGGGGGGGERVFKLCVGGCGQIWGHTGGGVGPIDLLFISTPKIFKSFILL